MKKHILTIALSAISLAAFAQGKVAVQNDATRLVSYTTDTTYLLAADAGKAGTAVPNTSVLKYQLYASPGDMTANWMAVGPVTTLQSGSPAGRIAALPVTLPSSPAFPGSTRATFQIKFFDASVASYDAAASVLGKYYGATPVFTAIPGASANNPLWQPNTPSLSTWAAGAVYVGVNVPEPASASIIGLGLASLLVFRRRN